MSNTTEGYEKQNRRWVDMDNFRNFGEMLKALRVAAGLSLREFCRKAGEDPANLSRIERVLRPAPSDEVVERYAKALNIDKACDTWRSFFDFSAISRRELPNDIASNEELSAKLPAILRTLRGEKPNEEDIEKALDIARKAFRPHA
jgi:transcriptional regulator with XRE-family HTH domain